MLEVLAMKDSSHIMPNMIFLAMVAIPADLSVLYAPNVQSMTFNSTWLYFLNVKGEEYGIR